MSKLAHKHVHALIQRTELPAEERSTLVAHLAHCAACREYAQVHVYLSRNLQLEAVRTRPAPELRARILDRVQKQHRRNLIMNPVRSLAAAAVIVTIVIFAFLVIRSAPEQSLASEQEVVASVVATQSPLPTETPLPTQAEVSVPAVQKFQNISYTAADAMFPQLDVHAPTAPGPWPVVIVVHATGRGRLQLGRLAEAIAVEGAVVYNISVQYTMPWTRPIEEIACAVRFARATAADYGGNPDAVTLLGIAPGATVSTVAALAGEDFVGECVVDDGSVLPDAVVGWEGLYDYATTFYVADIDHSYLEQEDPELWSAMNPYTHIGRNADLKVRLVHGVDEDTGAWDVRPQVSIDFHQALSDAGYDVTLTLLEGASVEDIHESGSEAFETTVQQTLEVARDSQ